MSRPVIYDEERYPQELQFDEKMRIIRSYAYNFWVLEDKETGNLEGRVDYEGFTRFIGCSPFINEIIDEVFQELYNEVLSTVIWQDNRY